MGKYWTKIKNILAAVGAAFIAALLFVLGRGVHGRGSDSAEDIIADGKERAERAADADRRAAEHVERAEERSEECQGAARDIAEGNRRASDAIDEALEIIERAEKRGAVGED